MLFYDVGSIKAQPAECYVAVYNPSTFLKLVDVPADIDSAMTIFDVPTFYGCPIVIDEAHLAEIYKDAEENHRCLMLLEGSFFDQFDLANVQLEKLLSAMMVEGRVFDVDKCKLALGDYLLYTDDEDE